MIKRFFAAIPLAFASALATAGPITVTEYIFLGRELGARSADPSCYRDGRVQYDLLARTEQFQHGLDRVEAEMKMYRLVLMCAEKEPLECHRAILVARHLSARGIPVDHILADGSLESHADLLNRLIRRLALPERDLFRGREDVLSEAYKIQESRIAYTAPNRSAAEKTFSRRR